MYILGINAYHADASACLFHDNTLVAASEEERFLRIKHWAGFPIKSVEFCLEEAGISITDVDHITIGRDPKAKILEKLIYSLVRRVGIRALVNRIINQNKTLTIKDELSKGLLLNKEKIKARIWNIEHHRSHMASTFFASPFKKAAILTIDGSGDFTTSMIGTGNDNKIKIYDSVSYPVSLGTFYTAFTQYLGFPYYGDEYKVMGLSSYGEPRYIEDISKIIWANENGLFEWDNTFFRSDRNNVALSYIGNQPVIDNLYSTRIIDLFGPPRDKDQPVNQKHMDIAASVQRVLENIVFEMLNKLYDKTKIKNLCLAGGVAQNSVLNGRIIKKTPFERLYIPPAGHDAGNAIGSALYLYNQVLNNPRVPPLNIAYTGSRFDNQYIKSLLKNNGIIFKEMEEPLLLDYTSEKLKDGKVVGWFQSKAEFGPRALGNRSILVDPRKNDAKKILNEKIKRRESFRPFAPSIMQEYVEEYFEYVDEVPFMEKVIPIKKEKHSIIPAVTHVDGSGRLQTVNKSINGRYYNLIESFRKKTGIPILLNTSFNENEPIVNSPEEALDCFLRTDMDVLVMENIVIER